MSEQSRSKFAVLGKIIGHIAVVASLIYVGYEIRLNTRVAQAQAHQEMVALTMSVNQNLIEEIEDISELETRADLGLDSLSESDAARYGALVNRFLNLYELAYYQYQGGLLQEEVWRGFEEGMKRRLQRPGFAQYWEETKPIWGEGFAALVDGLR